MTGDKATQLSDRLILDGSIEPDEIETSAGGGSVVALTVRDPCKDTENEDTVAVIPYGPEAVVLVVADGAGGLPAGKQASLTATTLTVVTIEGLVARSFQIGDSEALIVSQGGTVRAQTTAHSPTGFAVEAGFLDQREALHHEERHLVSNFLGTSDMRIDMGAGVELRPRDTVLIASDGLTDNVHLDEIIERIRKGPLLEGARAAASLAQHRMANGEGRQPSKPDDLSLILFRKPESGRGIVD